jgi:hypothetical protein
MKGFNMQSHSGSSKTAFMAGFAALTIGAVAWSGHLFALLALLILPMVFTSAKGTAQRLTVLGCYYAASIWPVMPGATQFFGDNAGLHPLSILILWLISSLVLTLPWVWLLLTPGIKAEWALPVGLCLTALLRHNHSVWNPVEVQALFDSVGGDACRNLLCVAPRHTNRSPGLARPRHRTWRFRTIQTNADGAL